MPPSRDALAEASLKPAACLARWMPQALRHAKGRPTLRRQGPAPAAPSQERQVIPYMLRSAKIHNNAAELEAVRRAIPPGTSRSVKQTLLAFLLIRAPRRPKTTMATLIAVALAVARYQHAITLLIRHILGLTALARRASHPRQPPAPDRQEPHGRFAAHHPGAAVGGAWVTRPPGTVPQLPRPAARCQVTAERVLDLSPEQPYRGPGRLIMNSH